MDEHEDHERHDARWFTWAGVVVAGALAFSLAVGLVILPPSDPHAHHARAQPQ